MKLLFQLCCFLVAVHLSQQKNIQRNNDKDWWKKSVFYQIYPRSFKDSDGNGVGDLKGIISKIEHLKDAGINATWLSPIFKSPMVDFGYDIQDFLLVDPIFGTNDDLKELIDKAHALGIKIILDLVPNHTSQNHTWFVESAKGTEKYKDYYIWRNGTIGEDGKLKPPNNWLSVFGGSAWQWHEGRQAFYYHQFAPAQPDLNYRNPVVQQEMKDVIMFWIDFGVDGFRIDAINHMFEKDHLNNEPEIDEVEDKNNYESLEHIYTRDLDECYDIVAEWRKMLDEYSENNPDLPYKVIMTEAYTEFNLTMRWYGTEDKKISNVPFNFALILELTRNSTAKEFEDKIHERLLKKPKWALMNWVTGNHDRNRVASRYHSEQVDSLNMLAMTLPGVAVTYYGEEIGMLDNQDITWEETQDPQACQSGDPENYRLYSRDPVRTPMQWDNTSFAGFSNTKNTTWLPVHPKYLEINLKAQKEANHSHFKVYQDLISIRQNDEFLFGDFQMKSFGEVLVYARSIKTNSFYGVAINLGEKDEYFNIGDVKDLSGLKKPIATVKVASLESQKGMVYVADKIPISGYQGIVFEVRSENSI